MWNWQAILDYIKEAWSNNPDEWKNIYDNGAKIIEIFNFENSPGYFVTLHSGENTDYENHTYSVKLINKLLNPKYQIETPLFESDDSDDEDDDWNVDSSFQNFNIECVVSSTYNLYNIETDEQDIVTKITKCILNSSELEQELEIYIPHNSGDIKDILYENLWDNDWLINKLMEGDTVVQDLPNYFYDDDYDNEWEGIKIDVKILDKLNESNEDDDWNVDSSFTVKNIYLGKGDTIEPGIINSRGSYYIVGFEDNNVLLKKNNSEYISKFPIDMVQNKMEDGYILDPYK
jgi:hypothetical protein